MNNHTQAAMTDSPNDLLREAILDNERFVEAVFQGARGNQENPWARVTIRPILLKEQHHLQFEYFDGKQAFAKNHREAEAEEALAALVALPFKNVQASTTEGTTRIQYSKKGRPIIHHDLARQRRFDLDLAHDRAKPGILSEEQPAPFLSAIGVATADGRVRADQQRKFRQINEFLRLIDETREVENFERVPVRVVDLGCGSAALTFATYHYLNNVKGISATMTGVDTKSYLLDRHRETATQLEWPGMIFEANRIIDFEPTESPDIVLALHACDTATDEALAQAVRWRSKLIFSAPCCHHHLQAQLSQATTPEPFKPILRQGIMRERLGDVLTDSFRATILRLFGYRADIMEFVAVEHTPKNLMIRAVLVESPPPPALINEYIALKTYWGVTPYLEELLRDDLNPILAAV